MNIFGQLIKISARLKARNPATTHELAEIEPLRQAAKNRALLSEAVSRLEQEDPAWQQWMRELQEGRDADSEFVSAAPGADWDPED